MECKKDCANCTKCDKVAHGSICHDAAEEIEKYCDTVEDCNKCILRDIPDCCDPEHLLPLPVMVLVADKLQTAEGRAYLEGMEGMDDLSRAAGLPTKEEKYQMYLVEEEKRRKGEREKDARIEELANLLYKSGNPMYKEAADLLMEYNRERQWDRDWE